MRTNETSMPLALELAESQPLPNVENWERSEQSNSNCVNYGVIQIDDVQIDEVDVF